MDKKMFFDFMKNLAMLIPMHGKIELTPQVIETYYDSVRVYDRPELIKLYKYLLAHNSFFPSIKEMKIALAKIRVNKPGSRFQEMMDLVMIDVRSKKYDPRPDCDEILARTIQRLGGSMHLSQHYCNSKDFDRAYEEELLAYADGDYDNKPWPKIGMSVFDARPLDPSVKLLNAPPVDPNPKVEQEYVKSKLRSEGLVSEFKPATFNAPKSEGTGGEKSESKAAEETFVMPNPPRQLSSDEMHQLYTMLRKRFAHDLAEHGLGEDQKRKGWFRLFRSNHTLFTFNPGQDVMKAMPVEFVTESMIKDRLQSKQYNTGQQWRA